MSDILAVIHSGTGPRYLVKVTDAATDNAVFQFTQSGIRFGNTAALANLTCLQNYSGRALHAAALMRNPGERGTARGLMAVILLARLSTGQWALGAAHCQAKVAKGQMESLRWYAARALQQSEPDAPTVALRAEGRADDSDMLLHAGFLPVESADDGLEGEALAELCDIFGFRSVVRETPHLQGGSRSLVMMRQPGQWNFMPSRRLTNAVPPKARALEFQSGKLKAEVGGKLLELFNVNVCGEATVGRHSAPQA